MADQEVSVKITADVKSLLEGMKSSQEAVEGAVSGMKGDLGSMIEAFEKFGIASLAIGAAGLAFEALKEAYNFVGEAVEKTHELAESFKVLSYATGATIQEMNQYTAAIELSGGSTENLQGLLVGMQRGIKANSDVLIANGVAADKAALQGMSFADYLERVHEIAENMATPTEREQFLILALGRGGAMAGAMLGEFVENLKKTQGAMIISPESMKNLEESKESIGRLKIAQQEYAATVSAEATPIANWFRDLHTSFLQADIDMTIATKLMNEHLIQAQFTADGVSLDYKKMEIAAKAYLDSMKGDMAREQMHAANAPSEKQHLIDKPDLEAQKAAAAAAAAAAKAAHEERIALAKNAAQEELKIAMDSVEAQIAEGRHLVTMEVIDFDEMTARAKAAALQKLEAQKEAAAKEIQLAEGNAAVIAGIRSRMADEERAYQKTVQSLDDAAEKHWKEVQDANLAEEQKFAELDRKIHEDIAKDIEKNQKKRLEGEMRLLDQMTQGWDAGIQKMLHGQMSLKDGVLGAARQMEDQVEKSLINMGIQWVKYSILSQIESEKAHMAQVMNDAKSAAAGAWNATVGIPFIGPVLAPVAAAASFAGVMAFAEGGWDRVPSDQVAMIHKNEMVLPAHIANPLRESIQNGGALAAAGGSGGGDVHLHMSNLDSASFASFLGNPANKRAVLQMFQGAMRNGRTA